MSFIKTYRSALLLLCLFAGRASGGNLVVKATGAGVSGQVYFILFNEANGFPGNEQASLYTHRMKVVEGRATWHLSLPAGRPYAIAAFYDTNGNGRLDKNIFGAPTEPYGFSGNVRPLFRAPSFREASFEIGTGGEIRIQLK